ncbi:MAG: sugar phosphate isomerase, partial [Limisphaerales bacterium]
MKTNRRQFMLQASSVAMASCLAPSLKGQLSQSSMKPDYVAKGPIRHSVMGWCFNPMSPAELARQGKQMGLSAIEGIPVSAYAEVKAMGLHISLVSGGHGFAQGP